MCRSGESLPCYKGFFLKGIYPGVFVRARDLRTNYCRSMSYLTTETHQTRKQLYETTQTVKCQPKQLCTQDHGAFAHSLVRKTKVKPIHHNQALAQDSHNILQRRVLTACFLHPSWWRDTQVADHATFSTRFYRASF